MTEKKELIQQLKETDPDTYKKYRLEYMKSLFDLKKFQFLFLKNDQSRTWTEDYMKNLLSKRNDLLFDASEIYHASLSAIFNDEFFKDNYYSLDEFLLKEKADRDYLKELSISDLSKAVQMKYSKICPIYFLNQAEKISFDVLNNVYQNIPDYLIPKNCKYFERASAEEILALIRANPFSLQSIPDHLITKQYVYHYLGLMIANERDEYIDQYVKIPMRFRDQNFYESYCIVNGYNYMLVPPEKFDTYVSEKLIRYTITTQKSYVGFLHLAHALSIRNYQVPEDIWLQLCYHHFACMVYVPKELKTEQFFDKLMAMEGFHFSIFEPEMTDAQLITCLENSRHIDSDKIKKARKVWTPELLEAIAANCTYPLKIIPKKYVTLELVKIGLKNERHYLSDVPKDYLSKELCIYAYIHHPFRTMEVIPDEFKTPGFYAEIIKHGEFYPKDIPNEYLTEEALIQYVSSKKCYGLDDIPDPWKTTPAVMKAFSDYHIDRYIYPDEEHCERACERAEKIGKRSLEYILSKCEIQPSKYVWDVICNSRTGIHAIKNPTREMWRASIQEFPENILEAPEWFLQTDSLTIVSTSAKHIDEKKKIEEKLERAAEQCSLDNQMSIFDLFPDF